MDGIQEAIESQPLLGEEKVVTEPVPIPYPKDVTLPDSDLPLLLETLKVTTPTSGKIGEATEKNNQNQEKWYIHPLLLDYDQCFFNWIPNDIPFTFEEADTILQVLVSRYENIIGHPHLVDKYLKWCPVEFISQHLIIAFIHSIQYKFNEASNDLTKVAELIEHAHEDNFLSNGYIEGFKYLLAGLEALEMSLVLNSSVPKATDDLKQFLAIRTKFIELSKSAKVVIKGARVVFVGSRNLHEEEYNLLKEITDEDEPNSVEWLTNLFRRNRASRKTLDYRLGPSEEEKKTLLRAIELDPNHVMVKLYVCRYFSDIIKAKTWNPHTGTFKLGTYEFKSIHGVVNFIKVQTNEIISEMNCYGKISVCVADIFGMRLPPRYQDLELAKKCLSDALKYNPKSCYENRLMGLLTFLNDVTKVDEANTFIKKTCICGPRNFGALIDLVHILLYKPNENAEELSKIFSEQVKPELWSPNNLAALEFHQGIYNYMQGDKDAAVKAWITMYQTDEEIALSFKKKLSYSIWRYHWNTQYISIANVNKDLNEIVSTNGNCLSQVLNSQEFDVIVKLLEVVTSGKYETDTCFPYRGQMRDARSNRLNYREQRSSYQGRETSAYRGRGSSASHYSGGWRGQNERSLQQTDEPGDGPWR